VIYFIKEVGGEYVKIGYTSGNTPADRIQTLQIGNPRELVLLYAEPGEQDRERLFHRIFADDRVRGEWFKLSPTLQGYIDHTFPIAGLSDADSGAIAQYRADWATTQSMDG